MRPTPLLLGLLLAMTPLLVSANERVLIEFDALDSEAQRARIQTTDASVQWESERLLLADRVRITSLA